MFGFLIILACMAGGLSIGTALFIGGLFWSGRYTLPHSDARRLQRAKIDAEIAETRTKAAISMLEADKFNFQREIAELQSLAQIEEMRDKMFQKQLEAPKKEKR